MYNIVVGHNAFTSATTGYGNTIIGTAAGAAMTNGYNNVLLGNYAGSGLTTGYSNTVLGNGAGRGLTTGAVNVILGESCGSILTTAYSNVVIGNGCCSSSGTSNIASVVIGDNAGYSLVSDYSICIGSYAGAYLGQGAANANNNICIGRQSGYFFIGYQSVFIGLNAGFVNTNGSTASANNIGIGTNALGNLTSGSNNTCIGTIGTLGNGTTSGSNISTLGYNALPSSATVSNQITLGNTSVTSLRCAVTSITSTSDARDKKDIEDLSVGLEFVNKLRPVKFTWNMRPDIETDASGNITEIHSTKNGDVEAGFIAQELDSAQDDTNNEWLNLVYKENPNRLEATQGKLIPILVKAIQDLSAKVDSLSAEIAILKATK
jgi:hypothetical protein